MDLFNILSFYLVLVIGGIAAGLFILFERLVLKNWWMVPIMGLMIGSLGFFLMNKNTDEIVTSGFFYSFLGCVALGLILSLGYLSSGLILNKWIRKSNLDYSPEKNKNSTYRRGKRD